MIHGSFFLGKPAFRKGWRDSDKELPWYLTEKAPRVEVFGPGQNFLPDAFRRIAFEYQPAVFQDLVLEERAGLPENDEIDFFSKKKGTVRL